MRIRIFVGQVNRVTLVIFALTAQLVSCASLPPAMEPSLQQAYCFVGSAARGAGAGEFQLLLTNQTTGENTSLDLASFEPIVVFPVSPGAYQITGLQMTLHRQQKLIPPTADLFPATSFNVQPGEIMYIGDVQADKIDSVSLVTNRFHRISYDFQSAVRRLVLRHPAFNGWTFKGVRK